MKKFVFIYNTLSESDRTPEITQLWSTWANSIERVVDFGNPFGAGKEVSGKIVRDIQPKDKPAGGYSIINAKNIDEAVRIASACPNSNGIRVYEVVPM